MNSYKPSVAFDWTRYSGGQRWIVGKYLFKKANENING